MTFTETIIGNKCVPLQSPLKHSVHCEVQAAWLYSSNQLGYFHVLYAQSHHYDQHTNLCHSPLPTMSLRRLTSPSRVNRKMNLNDCVGRSFKQSLVTQLGNVLTHRGTCCFEVSFAEVKSNKNQ